MRDDWGIKSNMLITIVPSYLAFKNAIALCLMSFFFSFSVLIWGGEMRS